MKYRGFAVLIIFLASLFIAAVAFADAATNEASNSKIGSPDNATQLSDSNGTQIPFKQDNGLSGSDVVKFLFAFLFVVVIAFAAIFVLKKYFYGTLPLPKTETKNINLIEAKRLSPKLMLFLVDVQGERILLAQCGDNLAFHNPNAHTNSNEN